MESNREDSEKCINIAENSVRQGDIEKALRFLGKAERLYPSQRAKDLIEQLSNPRNGSAASGNYESTNGGASGPYESDGPRRRTQPENSGASQETPEKSYTPEQLAAVKKIKKCKDYYEMLGVSKDCTEEDLKKAYRKVALKMHPDKNHAPGSTDAFKAISNAFSVLSNSDKRQRYDQYGSEAERSHSHNRDDYSRGFEGDISAEELFNMFFGGGFSSGHMHRRTFQPGHVHRRRHFYQDNSNQSESSYTALLQLAPILFMVVLTLLSSFLVSDPAYSLERTQKYYHERKTQNLGVPYYVKSDFHQEYKGSMRSLERHVEDDFLTQLRSSCFRERSYKENMLWRARGDGKLYERAQNIKTPACDRLEAIYS